MPWVAGVDGCRAGWIVVLLEQDQAPDASLLTVQLCASFAEVLALTPVPIVMAIDMPIGLLDAPQSGGRLCDRQARRLLGHRASSVFSPPSRLILDATHYAQVRGHGMSRQAFGILPKIREVDRLMTPTLQQRVYEAHPELAFRWLTGHPMRHNKKTLAGREERLQALVQAPGGLFRDLRPTFARALQTFKRPQAAPDDLLDAYVLAWTARRIVQAQAHRVPVHPEVDARGLRMEIWY
jgi:predicted RNase H-like nuclease